jgi:hypothetical protein
MTGWLAFTARLVFSASDPCNPDGSPKICTAEVEPAPTTPPMLGPGGGAGGTIGSLPSNINPILSLYGPGALAPTSSTVPSIVTFIPPLKAATPTAFGWYVNGVPVAGAPLPPKDPTVSFIASELKTAQVTFNSLVFVYLGNDGGVIAAVNIEKLQL